MAYWGPSPRSPSMNPLCTSPSSLHTMRIRNTNGSAYEHSFACDSAAAWHLSPSLEMPRETTYLNLVSSQQSAIRQTVRSLFPGLLLALQGPVSRKSGCHSVLGIPIPKSLYLLILLQRFQPRPRAFPLKNGWGGRKALGTRLQRFGHPPVPSRDAQIPSVVIPSKKNSGFRRKIENVLEMDSAKCRNFFQYLKKKVYPEGFTKICQKVRVWLKIRVLVLRGQGALRRLVISEGLRRDTLLLFLDTPAAIILLGKSKTGFTGLTITRTRWQWLVTNFIYLPMPISLWHR